MSQRRYFVLEEPCPASEVPNMMGRVVADKLLPLQKYAPLEPVTSGAARHNPQHIIPDILPTPTVFTNRKQFVSLVRDKEIAAHLTAFFGLDLVRGKAQQVELESEEVKRYSLKQPEQYFTKLMEDPLYARDVIDLLAHAKKNRGYLVTGFYTTKGTTWTRSSARRQTTGFSLSAPVATLSGIPDMGLLDPSIEPSITTKQRVAGTWNVDEEEIFAVSYSLVTTSRSFDPSAPKFYKKSHAVGPAVRAKKQELAFRPGKDDSDSEDDEAEELTVEDVYLLENEEREDKKEPFLQVEVDQQ